ncbi:MAG TPA: hypothetical protein VFX65_09705 [Candidatus Limnocylindrales bacterium]|nr:hypothetical protein [Candidatus Limnocylindrales bacterium]
MAAPPPELQHPSPAPPLPERILRRLPGPSPIWIALWGLLAPIRLGIHVLVLQATDAWNPNHDYLSSALRQVTLGYVVIVVLWFGPTVIRRIQELEPRLDELAASRPAAGWFPRLTSVPGPVALSALVAVAAIPSNLAVFGPVVAFLDVPLLFLVVLPIMTFVWAYGTLLVSLDRLGRAELRLDAFPQDRTLGLGPVGSAAMSGFWLLFASTAPVLVVAGSDLTTVAVAITVLAVTIGLFVLSMFRLHGQMRAAKARYVAQTRALVAEAYAPIRASTDLATVQSISPALTAAQSLADRADKLLEWPIDERMVTWMTVVVTGVVTSLVVRFVLEALGA